MINLSKIIGVKTKPTELDGFVDDLVKGVPRSILPKAKLTWRTSSLVQLWKLGCQKLLYLYLTTGREKEFDNNILQTFALGTKIHDLVKEFFDNSPEFEVLHNELPIRHRYLPLTGTMDHVVRWKKYPTRKFIVEIKSCATEYVNRPLFGSRIKPFKAARWQAGIYSRIYSDLVGETVAPIVLYYDKNNGELIPHLLDTQDPDVDNILEACETVWNGFKAEQLAKEQGEPFFILPELNGVCKSKPNVECHLADLCDLFDEHGKRIKD